MAYSANVPSRMQIAERYGNRTNDNINRRDYPRMQEGLPDSNNNTVIQYLSSEAVFYSIDDVIKMTGWSRKVVQRLFNAEDFPVSNLGKRKLVEAHALVAYFSVSRLREEESRWE